MQPMRRGEVVWVCNGEIYNWKALATQYGLSNTSGSDCEIIGELYERFCELDIPMEEFFRALDGVFAIVIFDATRSQFIIGRDPYGVRPLYTCSNGENVFYGSEMKSLIGLGGTPKPFLPGHYQRLYTNRPTEGWANFIQYHHVPFLANPSLRNEDQAKLAVAYALTDAVKKRMMTDRSDIAVTLSGGLDSSLIAALVAKELKQQGKPPPQTFSIGMKGSTDLFYARKVADWIGSDHTEIVLTPEDFFTAIPEVIRDIESFDTTTVRASVGNWLVAKAIRENSDCKIVFNGDGSDEVWGSYLYFNGAPSDHAFEAEVTRLLTDIHLFDVLRSDRSISSHGLEPRTPFLDKQFVAVARSVPTELRRPIRGVRPEKWLLREAFKDSGLLPSDVLWRQKEAFSDGVSGTEKSWYQITQEMALEKVGGGVKEPEKFYYRSIYDSYYGSHTATVNVPYFWMPRWSPGATDPSARTLAIYS
jgi:asparagine synthase (glutamine-hydrolysing)